MSDSKNTPETIADICREMRSKIDCLTTDPGYNHVNCRSSRDWARRIEAAKDAEIARLKEKSCEYALPNHGCTAEAKHFHKTVELERKVALLERALKPVMECNPNMQYSDYHCTIAVREAQRIMKEGGEK